LNALIVVQFLQKKEHTTSSNWRYFTSFKKGYQSRSWSNAGIC